MYHSRERERERKRKIKTILSVCWLWFPWKHFSLSNRLQNECIKKVSRKGEDETIKMNEKITEKERERNHKKRGRMRKRNGKRERERDSQSNDWQSSTVTLYKNFSVCLSSSFPSSSSCLQSLNETRMKWWWLFVSFETESNPEGRKEKKEGLKKEKEVKVVTNFSIRLRREKGSNFEGRSTIGIQFWNQFLSWRNQFLHLTFTFFLFLPLFLFSLSLSMFSLPN